MSDINTNTINLLNNQNYDYGTIFNEAVVEQNQTYFAYFDNVTPTGPAVIDQTAYQIKYLIDTEGDPVNPESDTVVNRPQAIALYNLKNNFESGKNAIVKLIENDPLYAFNPYNDALSGKHPITYVGKIAPLATTEYGQLDTEYIPTMSFQEYNLYTQGNYPNFSFTAYPSTGISWVRSESGYGSSGGGGGVNEFFNFDIVETNELGYYDETTSTYTFGQNTADYGLEVSFELSTEINASFNKKDANITLKFSCYIEYSTDNGVTWDIIDVTPFDNTYGSLPLLAPYINQGTIETFMNSSANTGLGYRLSLNSLDFQGEPPFSSPQIFSTPNFYNSVRSTFQSFQTGDQVRCRWVGSYSYVGDYPSGEATGSLNILSLPSTSTRFQLVSNTGYVNTVTSSYFDDISLPPSSSLPFQPQYLTASLGFSRFINNNLIQVFDSSILAFNYQQPTYPLNISPGDKIRCEYNPYQVSTIIEVTQVDESPSRKCLVIYPPIIPNGATLDHFTIYRVIDDGSSIILNVPPPQPGTVFSGIVQPEFISQELVNKYDKIIVGLTEREIIN